MSGLPYRIGLLGWVAIACAFAGQSDPPVSIHSDNPRYFLFRGKPTFLLSATEHYGSVLNRAFDFEKYLNGAAEHKMTMTRTFLLFRELQGARNPASPAKPDSPDYLAPFPRTGPGQAMDGEPLYDLDRWNPEYFDRLHRFLRLASEKGIIVELTLFSNTYSDRVWELNPFRAKNNRQGVGNIEWPDYTSLRDQELVRRQSDYVRKIIGETAVYDNIYYEICNEPGGGIAGHASPAEVDTWQERIAGVMRDAIRKSGRRHLIAGQQAFAYSPKFRSPYDQSFRDRIVDIVNVHPLPDTVFGGRAYQLGNFMSKELMLGEFADFTRAVHAANKPMVHDEDNAASMYRDRTGWTIHRKRAWTALLNGAHYDYIDFSITVGNEAGTAASRAAIRGWMRHLSEFMSAFDFIRSRPRTDWIQERPEHLVVSALASGDRDYAAYLADAREVTEAGAGQPIGGKVTLQLPRANFAVTIFSPATGQSLPARAVQGGRPAELKLLPFRDDIVIRATRTAR